MFQPNTILLFNGFKGVGKTTLCSYLEKAHGYKMLGFADVLKEMFCKKYRLDIDVFEDRILKEKFRPSLILYADKIKNTINSSIFADKIVELIKKLKYKKVVIHDFRYPEEIYTIALSFSKTNIKTFNIQREGIDYSEDPSENQLIGFEFDYFIQNENLNETKASLDLILEIFF
jgi:hypothetical protein